MQEEGYVYRAAIPAICVIATLATNIPLIILLLRSERMRRDITTRVIAALAIADIGFSALAPAISAGVAWAGPGRSNLETVLIIQSFVVSSFGLTAIWLLTLASVVKCCVIVRPMTYWNIFSEKRLDCLIVAVWVVCLLMSGAMMAAKYNYKFNWTTLMAVSSSRIGTVFGYIWVIVVYLIPLVVMMFVYGKIFLVVRYQIKVVQPITILRSYAIGKQEDHNIAKKSARNKVLKGYLWASSIVAAKNLFIMCSAYILTYLPIVLLLLRWIPFPGWYIFTSYWLYMYSGFINAFLYIVLHRTVRSELSRMFCPWFKHSSDLSHPLHPSIPTVNSRSTVTTTCSSTEPTEIKSVNIAQNLLLKDGWLEERTAL